VTARITGLGTFLPAETVTNDDLARRMDTSDEWIRSRSGIGARRVGGRTAQMATAAAAEAMQQAGLTADQIDFLVLCTTTPEKTFPATSALVADALGLRCGAMDLNVVCAGFPYGYVTAYGLMLTPGGPERVLLVGSDAMSSIVDWDDRSTAILFGDGAGAAVLERHPSQGELLAADFGVNGELAPILYCDLGDKIKMEGREVFKRAVRAVSRSVEVTLEKAGLAPTDLDVVLPHQANMRIIEAMCDRIGIPLERTFNVIEQTGNTSSASIPLAMAAADRAGALAPDRLVLMAGFGAGLAWGSVVIRW
jgi:3-oxoacyl-[acyl-carrier-protein] synthase-3